MAPIKPLCLLVALFAAASSVFAEADAARAKTALELVGAPNWNDYFPFRLGDSWTYDWKSAGPMAGGGSTTRTRAFEGTSFLSKSVGYKLLSDDGTYHLFTFENGVLAIHSSLESGRYFDYDPALVIASPDVRVGEPLTTTQTTGGRTWTTTLLGLERVEVPLATFERTLAIRVEMRGNDFASTATHYFAPRVGLVAYRYALRDVETGVELLAVDARLRLARLGGVNVSSIGDLGRMTTRSAVPSEDRGLRQQLQAAMERRYTWGADFGGFRGRVELVESGKATIHGTFVVNPDLSVKVDASDEASRAVLRNELSSFVTHRKPTEFDVTYAETTFVQKATDAGGGVVLVAAGDPLLTTYTVNKGEIVEMGRSMGRVSYQAREKAKLKTDDGRLITVEYDVTYRSNETQATIATEHTWDGYTRLGHDWVPQSRRVNREEAGKSSLTRQLTLTDLHAP